MWCPGIDQPAKPPFTTGGSRRFGDCPTCNLIVALVDRGGTWYPEDHQLSGEESKGTLGKLTESPVSSKPLARRTLRLPTIRRFLVLRSFMLEHNGAIVTCCFSQRHRSRQS
jgi:hypothetical protein